ncbi:MAG: DUF3276 family protein [Fimbriimonadaceae bacterium]|nr:DUF3276 family protein [Fimbriimonadaceae bacterium]
MSTVTTTKSVKLSSQYVQAGKRSYFFDLKKSGFGEVYFTISQLVPEGNTWTRSTVLIPAEHARAFYDGLCATIKEMRQAMALEQAALEEVEQRSPAKTPSRKATSKQPPAQSRSVGTANVA